MIMIMLCKCVCNQTLISNDLATHQKRPQLPGREREAVGVCELISA